MGGKNKQRTKGNVRVSTSNSYIRLNDSTKHLVYVTVTACVLLTVNLNYYTGTP